MTGCKLNSIAKSTKNIVNKQIDLGKTEGNIYKNSFFNMTVTIPKDWVIASDADRQKIIDQGKAAIAGEDKTKQAQLKLSELRTVYLLLISKNGLSDQSADNPNYILMAEKLSLLQNIKKSSSYLQSVKTQLLALKDSIPYTFNKEIYSEKVGKRDFSVLEASMDLGTTKMTQKYYTTITNGYALSFITTSTNTDGDNVLNDIIKKISLK